MEPRSPHLIPAAILLGGLVIAVGIYMLRTETQDVASLGSPSAVRPINPDTDHIIGSPSAPVVIVEYSDLDCEFCTEHTATLTKLMEEYAPAGKVAWVYRHFPIISSHADAANHAIATECAAKLGGMNAFWKFMDAMHAASPYGSYDTSKYGVLIAPLNIDAAAFNACLTDSTIAEKVADDYGNALATGADGAPYTLILVKGQAPEVISGSVPYATMKKVIQDAIAKTVD